MIELVKPGDIYDIYLVDDSLILGATIMSIDDHWMEVYHKRCNNSDVLETKIIPLSKIASLAEPLDTNVWYLETITSHNEISQRSMQYALISRTDYDVSKAKGAVLFDNYVDAEQALREIKEADKKEMTEEMFKGVKYTYTIFDVENERWREI